MKKIKVKKGNVQNLERQWASKRDQQRNPRLSRNF